LSTVCKGFILLLRIEAQIDLDEIFMWYEEQQIGLGAQFIQGLFLTFSEYLTTTILK
jgi:hypothetical protein